MSNDPEKRLASEPANLDISPQVLTGGTSDILPKVRYRILQCLGAITVPFGVAFEDDQGKFLFVPEWRSAQPFAGALESLDDKDMPSTCYHLQWDPAVKEWDTASHGEFDPAGIVFGKLL